MQELLDLLARRNEDVPLDLAALQVATIEHPEMLAEPYLGLLDSHAAELGERMDSETTGEEFVALLNQYHLE
jgi:hypothetical protein